MNPVWVNPETLHDVWPWVRDGCERVRKKTGSKWLPEDVYGLLRHDHQNTHLFLLYDGDERVGFIVLKRVSEFTGPALFVWVIHGRLANIENDLYAWLRELRAKGGFRRVWWTSPRKWETRPGIVRGDTTYELE